MKKSMIAALTIVAAVALPAMLAAQLPVLPGPPVDPNLQFEAASIKPYDASSGQVMMRMMPGQLDAVGVPARLLLRQALRVQDYQMINVPPWVDNDRYAIVAKAPSGAPQNGTPVMLLNLLKERFKLATHTETRELPIYNLVLARPDGKLGASLRPSSPECQAQIAARTGGPGRGAPGAGPGGPGAGPGGPAGPAGPGPGGPGQAIGRGPGGGPGAPPPMDFNNPPCGAMGQGPGISSGGGVPIAQLVTMLSQQTGRPVIDKTGLTGIYDFTLKYAPDSASGGGPLGGRAGGPPPGAPPLPTDPDAPNIYTAIQEQLGLKLDNQRGPVDVTVIDHIEKPALD